MYFVLLYAVITYNVLYRTYDGFIMLVFVVFSDFHISCQHG